MSDEKNLSDDLNDMLGDAKEGAKKAAGKAGEFADDAKEKAKHIADEAKETASEFADSAKETFASGGENKKILAGILGILFGGLGVHKFILGYNKEGGILLGATLIGILLSCVGVGLLIVWVPGVVGFIEGIIYLTKSDEEFYNTYQVGKKPWF
ncbi:TM2 domain-containing protein [Hwangdonia lutea]|uniref:TM2 domain-containing protein n=1 Tax=Hwangdonia lutea TaxID=3075823 RepID=A0AA97HS02_9FLAO|nr:TM2 domain-containing protein [Hwangdonia sp. SCSIO 19198]WOD45227.1 TM2 domain-containing protein [Hwangdonia sp. SCSIO 19198]